MTAPLPLPADDRRPGAAARRIAGRFDSRFLRSYTRSKLASDPLYAAVTARLRGHDLPLLDIGCGAGLMAFYLREYGFRPHILGLDHDPRKIAEAQRVARCHDGLEFRLTDARQPLPPGRSVLLLDVLHYLDTAAQAGLLASIASLVPPGGVVIIRDGVRDYSWRYAATYAAELFARGVHWIRADRIQFPLLESVTRAFEGWDAEVTPLWGSTPFNNYLFVFRRPTGGMTNS